MCRLLGIVASEPAEFGLVLTEAPRCLATLSREHRDGWGIAIHDADAKQTLGEDPWRLHRGTAPAVDDHRFHALAAQSRGHMLVAHVRQKTVGPTRLENTHPFVREGWVFAHNGTIQNQDAVRAGCSGRRLREITGDTDSELFFAYVLTRLDERGLARLGDERSREAAHDVVGELTSDLRSQRVGAFNFLLSDGQTTFAHRFGRSLFVLQRGGGASITTKRAPRREAVFIASERITEEPWREVADGTLLRIERTPTPRIITADMASSRALPAAS